MTPPLDPRLHYLAPQGIAGFVLANGSMSSQQSGEGEIRKALVEDDLVWRSSATRCCRS